MRFPRPGNWEHSRVNAQQARRFLTVCAGFHGIAITVKKIARGLSAGRVQSVAVRLVVGREREIKAFVPEEFWDVHADLTSQQKRHFACWWQNTRAMHLSLKTRPKQIKAC